MRRSEATRSIGVKGITVHDMEETTRDGIQSLDNDYFR